MSDGPQLESLIIRASAGSGKTYRLTQQIYAALLEEGASERPERLLAMTFTRAAAGEIRDRVLRELAEAASSPEGFAEHAPKLPVGTTREDVSQLLLDLVGRLDRLRISTIDAFFMSLARAYAFDLDMPQGWRVGDALELADLRRVALEDVWESLGAEEVMAILFELGKGKASAQVTETIDKLLASAYHLARETPPEAWDWLEPTIHVSDDEIDHAFEGLAAVRLEGTDLFDRTRQADLARFESRNWKAFLKTGLTAAILADKENFRSPRNVLGPELTGLYAPLITGARAALIHELASRTREIRTVVLHYEEALSQRRQRSPVYGFGDVAYRLRVGGALGLLDVMAYRLDSQLDHLLVDEFQDTSMDQWDVIRPLAESVTSGGEGPRTLMCVGDVKQSLYAWRGGRFELLERLADQLPAFSGRIEPLTKTYRSSPVVLEMVNGVFGGIASNAALRSDAAKDGARAWATGFDAHTAHHTSLPGAADLRVARDGVSPLLEAAELARAIKRSRPGASIGILVRGNSKGQIARVVRALAEGTPSVIATGSGGNPLSDSVAVELMLSLLTLLDHPGDTVREFHVWRSPLGREIAAGSTASGPLDKEALEAFVLAGRAELIDVGYARAVRRWMEPLLGQMDAYDLERSSRLLDLLASEAAGATLRPSEVVRLVRETRVAATSESPVQVMTIHKSKGLEFDVVILPDLGGDLSRPSELMTFHRDPLDPAERVSAYASAEIAEAHPALAEMRDAGISQDVRDALCALYVALTRAKQAVHCIIEASSTRERQLPVTYAGLLRGALLAEGSPATAGETLWAAHGGTADWHLAGGEEADALPEAPEDWVAPKVGSVPGRRLPRTSPSRLEGDAQILGGRALDSDPQALRRGTVLHAWLEAIEWLEQEPDPARLATQAAAMGVEPEDAQAWAAELLGALERPSLRVLLTRPEGDVEVRVEQPFEMSVAAGTSFAQRTLEERTRVSGSMDRLVIHRVAGEISRVEVIDYKSDRIGRGDPRALEERVRHYAPQLAVYRAAAARLLGCPHDRVESSLMFLHCDLHVPCA